MSKENRKEWRHFVSSNADLYIMGGWIECVLSNISCTGAQIITTHPISPLFNTKLRILNESIHEVKILWTSQREKRNALAVGMQFDKPIDKIDSIVEMLMSKIP